MAAGHTGIPPSSASRPSSQARTLGRAGVLGLLQGAAGTSQLGLKRRQALLRLHPSVALCGAVGGERVHLPLQALSLCRK